MVAPLSNSSIYIYNQKIVNLKTFFGQGFDFQTTDHNKINYYIIYQFNYKYTKMYIENHYFEDFIQTKFAKFEARYFDKLNNMTQKIIKVYCYRYKFQINHNFGFGKSYIIVML